MTDLLERELRNARDNLARAEMAARRLDPNKAYGESGRTLTELVADYREQMAGIQAAQLWLAILGEE